MGISNATSEQLSQFLKLLGFEYASAYTDEQLDAWLSQKLRANPAKYPESHGGDYARYTGPQRVGRALHELDGILQGIEADRQIVPPEVKMLAGWASHHRDLFNRQPFREIIELLIESLADGVLSLEEIEDIRWVCGKVDGEHGWFDQSTADIQRLHGIMAGLSADDRITPGEIESLSDWVNKNDHLRGTWPYSEVESLCLEVLRDGHISADEERLMLSFFADFLSSDEHAALSVPMNDARMTLSGLCAVCPEVEFAEKTFCFTGKSERMKRREIGELITEQGGRFTNSVGRTLDYLIVGVAGNPAWAFSCYGRKVERAMQLRRGGEKVLIVNELDFWDCVEEA